MLYGSRRKEEWESDEYRLTLLTLWRCAGKTEREIAKLMRVDYSTLRKWKTESPAIREALENGSEELAAELAGYMVKRARGYECEETKTTVLGNIKKGGKIVEDQQTARIERVKKHVQPDVGAQIFLLTNLQPDIWKNTQRMNATVEASLKANIGEAVKIILPDNGRNGTDGEEEE